MRNKQHDEISRLVYTYLEKVKKVEYLITSKVNFNRRGGKQVVGMTIILAFSSISTSSNVLKDMKDELNEHLYELTGGRLQFILLDIKKAQVPVETGKIPVLERTSMWEQFNSTASKPKDSFSNYFEVKLGLREGM